jgi:hypothetical protein
MKMRGNTPPAPSYSPDVAGLLRWLRQPPSQWSALGWQNAPAWADAVERSQVEREQAIDARDECCFDCDNANAELEATNGLLEDAIAERDHARRQYCRGFVDFCPNPAHDELSLEDAAVEVAKSFGWDCFREDEEGEVTQ